MCNYVDANYHEGKVKQDAYKVEKGVLYSIHVQAKVQNRQTKMESKNKEG